MTLRIFAVLRSRGAAWDAARAMEEQRDWTAHAAFMDALHADGLVALVGPLEGTADALLIACADSPGEIRARLSNDPWERSGLLTLTSITPWTLRLGSLD